MHQTLLFASLTAPEEPVVGLHPSIGGFAVRGDLRGDFEPAGCDLPMIYELRAHAAGGAFAGSLAERKRRLLSVALRYDYLMLDAERDLTPDLLTAVPPERRIITWRGGPEDAASLQRRFDVMGQTPAAYYLMAPHIHHAEQGLAPLRLLQQNKGGNLIAYADGPAGRWTRPLSAYLGAPMVFGPLTHREGTCSAERLMLDFNLPYVRKITKITGIVGRSVHASYSPRLHNAGYRESGCATLYLPFQADDFQRFLTHFLIRDCLASIGLSLCGLTVIAPYKQEALAFANMKTPEAAGSGAANMMVRESGGWRAGSSDPAGVLRPLQQRGFRLAGLKAAVIGSGGAGRGAVLALQQAGAVVTLINRNLSRGRQVSNALGVPFLPLIEFDPGAYRLVVNATPVGRLGGPPPFDVTRCRKDAVVLEYNYADTPSSLMCHAEAEGIQHVDGHTVLRAQIHEQYHFLAGETLSEALLDRYLG